MTQRPCVYGITSLKLLILGLLLSLGTPSRAQECTGIEVTWPKGLAGLEVPVVVSPAKGVTWPEGRVTIGERPVQEMPGEGRRFVVLLPAGEGTVRHELGLASESASNPGAGLVPRISVKPGKSIDLLRGKQHLVSYVSGMRLPAGMRADRRRSTYIHPARDLHGVNLLDDFPKDHVHHRGISWMWPEIRIDGKTYDLWHLRGIELRFEKLLRQVSGDVLAEFTVQNGWYTGKTRVMSEILRVRVTPVRISGVLRGHMIDLDFSWSAVSKALTLSGQKNAGKGYGGLGVRLAPREALRITTSEGPIRGDSLHKRFTWADYSARFRGAKHVSGVALIPHPGNDGFPNEWILRRYGFIGECWPGLGTTTFEPDKPRRARYLVYVHQGSAQEAEVARIRAAWVNTPQVRVLLR